MFLRLVRLGMPPFISLTAPIVLALLGWASVTPATAQSNARFEQARKKLVHEVVVPSGVKDPRVIEAMLATPRHEFVPYPQRKNAYFDMALPIGASQTISSPFIVAYMTESLDPRPTEKVLEIGTGSGYQAAVLSPLVKDVYTIEIVETLGRRAERTLNRLGYENVHVRVGDGYKGWPEHAPFDKIIVTCSPEKVPKPLVQQLKEGGLMVVPVGERYQQTLYLFSKRAGRLESKALRPTLFVPMTGKAEAGRQVQPDPAHPQAINGDFEASSDKSGHVPGWYYQRQATLETGKAPQGRQFVTFDNQTPGRLSHALQGFGIDGRKVRQLQLSARVRLDGVSAGQQGGELPAVVLTFYDEGRRELGRWWLGPWRGTSRWQQVEKTIRVPAAAREGILRIGLFGATGKVSFDDVQIEAVP